MIVVDQPAIAEGAAWMMGFAAIAFLCFFWFFFSFIRGRVPARNKMSLGGCGCVGGHNRRAFSMASNWISEGLYLRRFHCPTIPLRTIIVRIRFAIVDFDSETRTREVSLKARSCRPTMAEIMRVCSWNLSSCKLIEFDGTVCEMDNIQTDHRPMITSRNRLRCCSWMKILHK
jgi:hypothetical protein